MLKKRAVTVVAGLTVAVLAACSAPPTPSVSSVEGDQAAVAASGSKPNIVFVLVDDLATNLVEYMPTVKAMQDEGASFENYFVSNSLCCPSRATIFTGRYPHNTEIITNTAATGGGYYMFKGRALDQDTFATDLQAAGYRTAMMGKYMNEYQPGSPKKPSANNPAGWDEWALAASGYAGFNYNLNQNGEVVHYGRAEQDYLTDVISERGQDFIKRAAAEGEPFMLELAPFTPHKPYVPAPRHENLYNDLKAPRVASYDKKNKNAPSWMASQKLTGPRKKKMDEQFRQRVRTTLSIDEMIADVKAQLRESGVADNTYIVFSSDNGYHMGEHSLISGKMTAFSTDIQVPLVVTGPDVPAGVKVEDLGSNIDLRSTFGDLAGATVPASVDGQSLAPLWSGGTNDRQHLLVEHKGMEVDKMDPDTGIFRSPIPPNYAALRHRDWLYVKYNNGQREYYDLTSDPYEMNNIVGKITKKRLLTLDRRLKDVRQCAGQEQCTHAHAEPASVSELRQARRRAKAKADELLEESTSPSATATPSPSASSTPLGAGLPSAN
ncbi:sulfatase [Kineosporia rhizophila]|uniref:sulfatase family protein n=1 Tax=Kineosporia rhizophila TaxID=84633 RepID=UPI001E4F99FF|nr:sulfatase [Kineosporia rhizophila]MCE0534569.1 sulfatase [Kineosporia rhizophila]